MALVFKSRNLDSTPKKSLKWYSYTFNDAGLYYNIDSCNKTGNIVYINDPFPCSSCADLKIFSENVLDPGENDVVLDCGYRGDSFIYAPHDTHNIKYNHVMRVLRAKY